MSINSNIPQIAALKIAVEKVFGAKAKTHNDFVQLVEQIDATLREHMSESTLERLWGYSTRDMEAVSERSLNVLARFAGYKGWEEFCNVLSDISGRESEEIPAEDAIDSNSLAQGAILRLGWLPDRIVEIYYQGEGRFKVLKSLNSSINTGDCFDCLQFQKGRELYLDRFVRASDPSFSARYVVGQKAGLTTLEIIK